MIGNILISYELIFYNICFRQDRLIARKSREDPNLSAPEVKEAIGLRDISARTVQRRLVEVYCFL